MIQERYCSYEVSKLLQEKGFDEPCRSAYVDCGDYIDFYYSKEELTDLHLDIWEVLRPTHQMAIDWLREVHKLHIGIVRGPNGYHIMITSIPLGVVKYITRDIVGTNYVESFKDAVEAALEFCLTKLI